MIEYEIINEKEYLIIKVKGRIDGITSPKLENQLNELITDGKRIIIANLEEISYISSLGLRVFLKTQKKLKKINGEIIIHKPAEIVLDVLKMAGFDKILKIKYDDDFSVKNNEQEKVKEKYKNFDLQSQKMSSEKGKIQVFGNFDKMQNASYRQDDIINIAPKDFQYGLGLSALGKDYAQYKDFFGESLVIDHNLLVYPAMEQSAVDIMLAGNETYNFLNGISFSGEFAEISLLESPDEFISLEDFVDYINQSSEADYKGVVFLAESKGLWGMNLKKVPLENNVENIFARESIMKWLNFPIEPSDHNDLVLGVGVIAKKNDDELLHLSVNSNFHIHAAVIEDEILNKSFESFQAEWRRLLLESEIKKIQHLMGNSKFKSILCGIINLG